MNTLTMTVPTQFRIIIQGTGLISLVLRPTLLFVTMVSETWQLPVWFERVSGEV